MKPIVVEGRLVSPTQIELALPVTAVNAAVEVEIRPRPERQKQSLVALLSRLARRPARGRSQDDIDRQVQEERHGWESGR